MYLLSMPYHQIATLNFWPLAVLVNELAPGQLVPCIGPSTSATHVAQPVTLHQRDLSVSVEL